MVLKPAGKTTDGLGGAWAVRQDTTRGFSRIIFLVRPWRDAFEEIIALDTVYAFVRTIWVASFRVSDSSALVHV